uniref:Ig-like domain-containing protein n=1 Tax=Poecilia reticulata TaxID=8081 RepID=A0A3P9NZY0_POERE
MTVEECGLCWNLLLSLCPTVSAFSALLLVYLLYNITIYCDCKVSTGIYVVWFRNCSHEYQPTLVVSWKNAGISPFKGEITFPRFKFVKNESSNSYDLMIRNVTNSDEGIYYCGTFENKVEKDENKNIFFKDVYIYGNLTTRITLCNPAYIYALILPDVAAVAACLKAHMCNIYSSCLVGHSLISHKQL